MGTWFAENGYKSSAYLSRFCPANFVGHKQCKWRTISVRVLINLGTALASFSASLEDTVIRGGPSSLRILTAVGILMLLQSALPGQRGGTVATTSTKPTTG